MVAWRQEPPQAAPGRISLGSRLLRIGVGLAAGWIVGLISARLLVVILYPGWTGAVALAADPAARTALAAISVGAQVAASIVAIRYALRWRRSSGSAKLAGGGGS